MTENDEYLRDLTKSTQSDTTSDISVVTPGVYYPRHKSSSHSPRDTSRHKNARAILKNGEINIDKFVNPKLKVFTNWFVALVEARWRWTLLSFFLAYTGNWLTFGFTYWCIALTHGDLTEEHLPPNQNSTWIPCIENIYGFTSTFLFSIEVHTTVAYGKRAITLHCPDAIFAMCLQCIISSIFQAFMVGILFAKLTRPKARTQTILFSKHALVCLRDEKLCLIFRVGDMRTSRILNINARMFVIKLKTDLEYLDNDEQIELKTEMESCESSFFLYPISVVHIIDINSPLYRISAADLLCGKMEILVVFEGIIESTGQPVQARSSYCENDIIWGHRFLSMVIDDANTRTCKVDFSKFNDTEQIDTPLCSANEYENVLAVINTIEHDCDDRIKHNSVPR